MNSIEKITPALSDFSLEELAEDCGFQLTSNRSPGVDEWVLSPRQGDTPRQYTGPRQNVCAFLIGYNAMQLPASKMLDDLSKQIRDMRTRLILP